jgi:ribose/xylose/arabinose/galactoside ABC-type transport system permease subunit
VRRHVESYAPLAVAGVFSVPIFLATLLVTSLALDRPRVLGNKQFPSSGGTEAKVWAAALIAPGILLAIGALALVLGRWGVYAPLVAALVMCILLPSVAGHYTAGHARRFPLGMDYLPDTSASNTSSRGEWEKAAHDSVSEMAHWTLVLVGLGLAVALFVHLRGRRATAAVGAPPEVVSGMPETSPVVDADVRS